MLSATWFGFVQKFKIFRWQIISCLQHILLRNDDSTIALPFYQKKVFLSGVTAAKKCWFQGENLLIHSYTSGFIPFLHVLVSELSNASTNGGENKAIYRGRKGALEKVKAYIQYNLVRTVETVSKALTSLNSVFIFIFYISVKMRVTCNDKNLVTKRKQKHFPMSLCSSRFPIVASHFNICLLILTIQN